MLNDTEPHIIGICTTVVDLHTVPCIKPNLHFYSLRCLQTFSKFWPTLTSGDLWHPQNNSALVFMKVNPQTLNGVQATFTFWFTIMSIWLFPLWPRMTSNFVQQLWSSCNHDTVGSTYHVQIYLSSTLKWLSLQDFHVLTFGDIKWPLTYMHKPWWINILWIVWSWFKLNILSYV